MRLENQINKVLRRVKDPQKRGALKEGIREEHKEHAPALRWLKRNPEASVVQALKYITEAHLDKDKKYYEKTEAALSGKVKRQKGLKSPRLKLLMRLGWVRVYLVNATAVREMKKKEPNAADFTMGSNFAVWGPHLVPKGELWVSDELGPPRDPLELRLTTLHESAETRRMIYRGLSYDDAHDLSLALEEKYRKARGRGLSAALKNEAKMWRKKSGE